MQYVEPGTTSKNITMILQDGVTGGPYTTEDQVNFTFNFIREGAAAAVEDDTISAGTLGTWAEGTAKPFGTLGEWQIDFADAAFAAGVNSVKLLVTHDTGKFVAKSVVIDLSVRQSNLTNILGHLLEQTGTQIADAFQKFFDVATPTGTVNSIPDAVAGETGGLATSDEVGSIGSGATGGTHVEATYDNTTRDTIDNASADLKGGGLVGIPVTGHSFTTGREITIAGTSNYNGAFDIVSETTNEIVITHTQDAEAFGGSETIVSSIKGEIFVGTVTSGTFADTAAPDGTVFSMDDDGDVIKIVLGFNVGGSRQAANVAVLFNLDQNADVMVLKAYNFVTEQFETKRLMPGTGGSTFLPLDPPLVSRNTGTGTEIGDVFIFFDTETTTPASLSLDLCLLTAVGTNVLIGYPNGFEISETGTSGTEFGVNGTAGNPCPFADAITMNTTNPLNMFTVQNGETVELLGNSDGISLTGEAWTLALEGKSIVNMHTRGASVSGTSTGSGSDFHDCDMGTCTIAPCSLIDCRFTSKSGGGFTMQTAGDYTFHACASRVAGNDAPVFTFPGAGNTFISDRAGSGGRQYEGMSAGDVASIEGWGQFIEGTCSGGAVTIRGCLTLSGITNITITDGARYDIDQVQLAADEALVENKLDHLLLTAVSDPNNLGIAGGDEVGDDTIIALMLSTGGDADTYNFVTDSLQSNRDHATTIKTDTAAILDDTGTSGVVIPNGQLTTAKFGADFLTDALIADGAFKSVNFNADVWITSADALLLRNMSNVEDSAGKDTLCGAVLAAFHWDESGNSILVRKTDNTTLFATLTIDTDPDAEPVVQVT